MFPLLGKHRISTHYLCALYAKLSQYLMRDWVDSFFRIFRTNTKDEQKGVYEKAIIEFRNFIKR